MPTAREPATYPELEDAVQAARAAYRPAFEAGLESGIASCSDWFGWHAAIKAAAPLIPPATPAPGTDTPLPQHLLSELHAIRLELGQGLDDDQRDQPAGRAYQRLCRLINTLED